MLTTTEDRWWGPRRRVLSRRTPRARLRRRADRRQDAGQLQLPRARRAAVVRRQDHLLRPRPARHRAVDLHFRFYGYHPYAHDLADLGWYIAQHERLMAHWRAASPNPLMTVRLEGLGRRFHRHVAPGARLSRSSLRPGLRALLGARQPGAHGPAPRSVSRSTPAASAAGARTRRTCSR
jgi:hypothetical protein